MRARVVRASRARRGRRRRATVDTSEQLLYLTGVRRGMRTDWRHVGARLVRAARAGGRGGRRAAVNTGKERCIFAVALSKRDIPKSTAGAVMNG